MENINFQDLKGSSKSESIVDSPTISVVTRYFLSISLTALLFAWISTESLHAYEIHNQQTSIKNSKISDYFLMTQAIQRGLSDLKFEISIGTDINAVNQHGMSVLMWAAGYSQVDPFRKQVEVSPEMVKQLLLNGANLSQKDIYGMTAIMHAARYSNNPKVMKLLLDQKADFKAKDKEGRSVIHHASVNQHSEVFAKLLLEKGADIEKRNARGETPLIVAAANSDNASLVKLLLAKGANLQAKNKQGETALNLAYKYTESKEVIEILLQEAAKIRDYIRGREI